MIGFLWDAALKVNQSFTFKFKVKSSKYTMEDKKILQYMKPTKQNISPFQKRVYDSLLLIPQGRVTTYKLLGNFIGCRSAQAIGQALTKNQHAPEVPCHRVICTHWDIWWYAFGISTKRTILSEEGVFFDVNNKLTHQNQIWDFSKNH